MNMELQVASLKRISIVTILRLFCDDANSDDARLIRQQLACQSYHAFCNEVILKVVVDWYPSNLTDEFLCCLVTSSTQCLNIEKCKNISICGLREALKRCPELKSLNISGCSQLAHPLLPKFLGDSLLELKSLNFSDSKDLSDNIVQGILTECKFLEELYLVCCDSLTDKAFQWDDAEYASQPIHQFPSRRIKVIDISGCHQLSSTSVRHFSTICGPCIRKANLSWTNIDCSALLYLAGYSLSSAVFLATYRDGNRRPFSNRELNKAQLFEFQCMHGQSDLSTPNMEEQQIDGGSQNNGNGQSRGNAACCMHQALVTKHLLEQHLQLPSNTDTNNMDSAYFSRYQLAAKNVPVEHKCSCLHGKSLNNRQFVAVNSSFESSPMRSFSQSPKDERENELSVSPTASVESHSKPTSDQTVSPILFGVSESIACSSDITLESESYLPERICQCSICLPTPYSAKDGHGCTHSCHCGFNSNLYDGSQSQKLLCTLCPPCEHCSFLQNSTILETDDRPNSFDFVGQTSTFNSHVPARIFENDSKEPMLKDFSTDMDDTSDPMECEESDTMKNADVDIADVQLSLDANCFPEKELPSAQPMCPSSSNNTANSTIDIGQSSNSLCEGCTRKGDSEERKSEVMPQLPLPQSGTTNIRDFSTLPLGNLSHKQDDFQTYKPIQLYLPDVQELDISEINFYNQSMAISCTKMFVEANTKVTTLHISWKNLDDELFEFIVSKEKDLKVLSLVDCESLSNSSIIALGKHCTKLTAVDLKGLSFITDQGLQSLIVKGCHLQSLGLAESCISDVSLKRLARYCEKQLTHLDLSWCENITDSGLSHVISNCPNLRALDLRQCDASAKTFLALSKHVKCLKSLGLCGVDSLTDRHAVAILKNLTNLTDIDLSWNSSLTDESIIILLSQCKHIRNVALAGLKRLTSKPFLSMIPNVEKWRVLRDKITQDTLQDRGDYVYSRDFAVKEWSPCRPRDEKNEEAYHPDFFLPHRSYHYAPSLRRVDLSYCDKVNDIHLAEIIAVCRGTLHIDDYYGEPIRPRWNIL